MKISVGTNIIGVAPVLLKLSLAAPCGMAVEMSLLQRHQDANVIVDRLLPSEPRPEKPDHRAQGEKRRVFFLGVEVVEAGLGYQAALGPLERIGNDRFSLSKN